MRKYVYPSGKIVTEWTWEEWRNFQDSKVPKYGVILSKNKTVMK